MRRMWWSVGTALCAVVVLAAPAWAHEVGTVEARDRASGNDRVDFYFPAGTGDHALGRARQAVEAAGLPVLRVFDRTDEEYRGDYRQIRVTTTLSQPDGWLRYRIDGAQLQELNLFGDGPFVLQVSGQAELRGASSSGSDLGVREYDLEGAQQLVWWIPSWYLPLAGAVLLALVAIPPLAFAGYARRVMRRGDDQATTLHRLRRVRVAWSFVPVAAMPGLVLTGAFELPVIAVAAVAPDARPPGWVFPSLVAALLLVAMSGALVGVPALAFRYTQRLRGTTQTRRTATKRTLRAVGVLAVPMFVAPLVLSRARMGPVAPFVIILAVSLVFAVAGPLVLRLATPTTRLQGPIRERLDALLELQRLRVRDILVVEGRETRIANAAITGVLPWLRVVVVTDYLLDELDAPHVDAIVMHEIGHGKEHHLPLKLAASLALGAGLAALALSDAAAVLPDVPVVLIGLPVFVLGLVMLVHGVLGVHLERRADDYAAAAVGPQVVADALDRLAELNSLQRRTGRVWNLLNQHPGMEQRVARLRALGGSSPLIDTR